MDSPVIWAGGKRRLLPFLVPLMPDDYGKLIEPFAGGAAVGFGQEPHSFVLIDRNPWLINFYSVLRDYPDLIAAQWMEAQMLHDFDDERVRRGEIQKREHVYYKIRGRDPWSFHNWTAASWFFYLNRTCFNGLWRVNSNGDFNVPMGNIRRIEANDIIQAGNLLRRGLVLGGDFTLMMECALPKDFVYLDPPYAPVSQTSNFTSYTKEKWSYEDDKRLAECVRKLTSRHVHVMLSSSDVPQIRELYADGAYHIHQTQAQRSISAKASSRGMTSEIVITNY